MSHYDSSCVGMSHGWVMVSEWVMDESWMSHHRSSCVGMIYGWVIGMSCGWVVDESSWFIMRRIESWIVIMWEWVMDESDVGMSWGWVVDESSWFVIRRSESWISHDETRSITLERVMDESWWSVMLEWVIDESWHRSTCYKRCPSTRSGTGAWRGPLLYI